MVRSRLLLLLGLLFLLPSVALAQAKKEEPPTGGRHALLVGCTKYPNLSERFQLQGPANDVVLMRQVLTKYFKFTDAEVVTLSEKVGEKNADLLPTRKNIEREWNRLADQAKEGDYVFILMGGHGSQQPESGKGDPEPDGLDEIFLPRDVGKWEDKAGTVANVIVDKEFAVWLQKIRSKGASICIIFDACHSGTMTRGEDKPNERNRKVEAEAELGIPRKTIEEAVEKAVKREAANPNRSRGVGPPTTSFHLADKGGLVAISAAQDIEPTLERDMPYEAAKGQPYGLLTYTMCQILTQAAESNAPPLTYREIAQRVQQQYAAWGRTFPTPVIEGGDKDREFLGSKVWEGRSGILLTKADDNYKLNAGSLNGLTKGSIVAVYPPSGKGKDLLGHVLIKEVRVTDADVEPTEYEKHPKVADLPSGGVCKVVSVDYGDQRLRVSLDTQDDTGKPLTAELKTKLLTLGKQLTGPESLLEFVEDPKRADWLIRPLSAEKVILIPATGWVEDPATKKDPNSKKNPAFGPAPINDKLETWLRDTLTTIARGQNLIAIAARDTGVTGDTSVKIQTELLIAGQPAVWPSPDIRVFDKDKVRVILRNTGKVAADVTLLYLDSEYGIDALYPNKKRGEDNRLRPGEKVELGFTGSAKTLGQEHLILIAVKATEGLSVDYTGLQQKALDRFKRDVQARGKGNPLDGLFNKAAYGAGTTRALARDDEDSPFTTKLITWNLEPVKRPVAKK